jgi:hypothetical protein
MTERKTKIDMGIMGWERFHTAGRNGRKLLRSFEETGVD